MESNKNGEFKMSLLQEIQSGNKSMIAGLETINTNNGKTAEQLAEDFYSLTGLDLSDCLYRTENRQQLENYVKTGKLPEKPQGFDYSDLIEKGYYWNEPSNWKKAHYNGSKSPLELDFAGYKAYCEVNGIKPQDFANLKAFSAMAKAAQ